MSMNATTTVADTDPIQPFEARTVTPIPVFALGMSLGSFLGITFVLCVIFDVLFPVWAMHGVWEKLLPGFTWLTWPGFFIGLVESIAYGWYIAVIFAPLYNFFVTRSGKSNA